MDNDCMFPLSNGEDSDMRIKVKVWLSVIFQTWPEDSSGCVGKCFCKRRLAACIVKNLCSLEMSVVLQLSLA